MNDSVINTLKSALDQDPDDIDLRLHLAELLLGSGDLDSAREHYEFILQKDPAHLRALSGAAEVASEAGDEGKAKSYRKLIDALGHIDNKSERHTPTSRKVTSISRGSDNRETNPEPQRIRTTEDSGNITVGPWEDFEAPVTLDDVGGMEDVKKRLEMTFLAPLKNPELRKMYGKSLRGGMLLYGPPGCGKTFIARALAGELGATFMSVGLSDVLDMWMGESERNLHEIFETARRKNPAVLFFDEIDALGHKRSQLKNSGGRNVVNQMLSEMDSVDSNNNSVFMLAATNHPWDVDTALRRPGRFDRVMLVLPPDEAARERILSYHVRDRPVENIDLTAIARRTNHFSGADLAHLCESAVEYAMHDSITSGKVRPVAMKDFESALPEIQPSTRAWFETARNYAMFSNEGGVYDDLLSYLQTHKL